VGSSMSNVGTTQEDLERFLAGHHLAGAGLRRDPAIPHRTGNVAAHWRWEGIYQGLMQSGRLVTVGPKGMTGMRSVTGIEARTFPIWMNAQILMPGERTQAHRNTRSETRLVCDAPEDAVFVCEHEAFPMARGDVVISPSWTFHDHWNRGATPAIWVDGYDNGYNGGVNLNERLPHDAPYQDIRKPSGYSARTRGLARCPIADGIYPLPPVHYPWKETKAALDTMRAAGDQDRCEGIHIMLASPVDGGPTLPTIAWHVQLLEPAQTTQPHRHNSTTFYFAFEGQGALIIEGERLVWTKGDIFAVSAWKWHHHENGTTGDSILFSIDDWPAMSKLGFYRKEIASS
jgi:gentisate 1,2-dioxygenase